MNLQIINDCAGTDSGLPTAGSDPGQSYIAFFVVFPNNCIIFLRFSHGLSPGFHVETQSKTDEQQVCFLHAANYD